jgi:hypothetical protein
MKMSTYSLQGFDGQNKITRPAYTESVRHYRLLDKHELSMFDHYIVFLHKIVE